MPQWPSLAHSPSCPRAPEDVIDQKKIKSTGAIATKIIDKRNAQVIIGPNVEFVLEALNKKL